MHTELGPDCSPHVYKSKYLYTWLFYYFHLIELYCVAQGNTNFYFIVQPLLTRSMDLVNIQPNIKNQ